MTAQEQGTIRTVILHPEALDAYSLPEYRLLNGLGHDVAATSSADQTVELLPNDRPDLVIIDADQVTQLEIVQFLNSLPADHQPHQVAIFCDSMDDRLSELTAGLKRPNVRVLLKPLHMHGLL